MRVSTVFHSVQVAGRQRVRLGIAVLATWLLLSAGTAWGQKVDSPGTAPPPAPPPAVIVDQTVPDEGAAGAPTTPPPPPVLKDLSQSELYQRILKSTCFILAQSGEGYSLGTGWIANVEEKLIVTNHHVVGAENTAMIYFPAFQAGRLITDRQHYIKREKGIHAEVIDTDTKRDLAVLRLETLPADAPAIPLAETSPGPAERVHSIGNPGSSDAMWVYTSGTVRAVYETTFRLQNNQIVEATVVETQSPTNPGDSGGPVVNDRGELVAVVESHSEAGRLMTTFIDVTEVRAYLDEVLPFLHPETAEDYRKRALNYYNKGRLRRSVDDFTEAIRLDDDNADYYNERGDACYWAQDYDQAIRDYTQALRLNRDLASALSSRGWCFNKKGQYETALADFEEALKNDSRLVAAFNGRGYANMMLSNYDDAIKEYTQAIRQDPQNAYYYNERGVCYANMKDDRKAVADYSEAIRLNPNGSIYLYNRSLAYRRQGNYEGALADVNKAIEIYSGDPDYFTARGHLWYDNQKWQEAVDDYSHAIQMDSKNPYFLVWRGNTFARAGRNDLAQQDYDSARTLPGGPAALEGARLVMKRHDRRFLRVVNQSDEPIRVYAFYYTKGTDGAWHWYPGDPRTAGALYWDFEVGEAAYLLHKDFKIKGSKIRIWAEGLRSGGKWLRDQNQDVIICPSEGYEAPDIGTFTYTFE